MLKIVILVLLFLGILEAAPDRQRRNLLQFGTMIHATTGRGPLSYLDYGCWCGMGGRGTPVDGTDMCCKTHDLCYNSMEARGCWSKWMFYDYSIHNGRITCDPNGIDGECDRGTCQCDKAAAECLAANTYNESNSGIDWRTLCV